MHLESKSVKKNDIAHQHEFRKAISLSWINPKTYCKSNNSNRSIDEADDDGSDAIKTRSDKQNKRKSAHASDDSFKQNGNIPSRKL